MIIIADIGNSSIKWAIATEPDDVEMVVTTPHERAQVGLRRALRHGKPEALVIASVVPQVTAQVVALAGAVVPVVFVPGYREFRRMMPMLVKPKIEPGADRLANAMALRTLHGLPACAIDVGTAITFEVVDTAGRFAGGAIMPGEQLKLESLQRGTALLGRAGKLPLRTRAIGTTTAAAMASGIRHGIAGAVTGVLAAIEQELGETIASIVVTGGGGGNVVAAVRRAWPGAIHDEMLTMRGLVCAWREAMVKRRLRGES